MIYLIRHGHIDVKGEKRFVGQVDIPLSEKGRSQANALRQWFEKMPLDAIYASDLSRTLATAIIIGAPHDRSPVPVKKLREIDLGSWDGRTFSHIKTSFPKAFEKRGKEIAHFKVPGGESFSELQNRVVPAFNDIAMSAAGDTLIVAHAGVNRVILCHILGMPLSNLFRLEQDFGCINIIDNQRRSLKVKGVNITSW